MPDTPETVEVEGKDGVIHRVWRSPTMPDTPGEWAYSLSHQPTTLTFGGSPTMPDTLTPEELRAIRERVASNWPPSEAEGRKAVDDLEALLAHIDALTAAVEGLDPGSAVVVRAAVLAILRGEQ